MSKFLTLIVVLFLSLTGTSYGLVKFFQSSKISNDGTIHITFTYSAKHSDVIAGKQKIGNLPFSEEGIKDFFSSSNIELKKSLVYKDSQDSTIQSVTLDLVARDINKLTSVKALEGFKTSYFKRDSGMVFSWLVPVSFVKDNFIDTYQFLLTSDGKVHSTNGLIEGNNIKWFVFADKINPGGAYFVTTFDGSTMSSTSDITSENQTHIEDQKGSESGEKKKSCGLFSIELPIVVFLGTMIRKFKRVRK